MSASDTLNDLLREARDAYPEAINETQTQQACTDLAEKILASDHAAALVARLVRGPFKATRRTVTKSAEDDARNEHDAAQNARFNREENEKPRWSGDDKPRRGRHQPRSPKARDEAAEDRALAFLDLPIGIPGEPFGEVLWGDATQEMLRERRAMYVKRILGQQSSVRFIDIQIDKIEETGSSTLREAYAKANKLAALSSGAGPSHGR